MADTASMPASANATAAVVKHKSGASCAQAVLMTYAPKVGLSQEMACKLGTGLSGGMSCAETCGAAAAACCLLGLKHGAANPADKDAKARAQEKIREFYAKFAARHGYLRCRELLGVNVATPDGLQAAQDRNLFKTLCPQLVQSAAEILDEML